MKQKFKIALFTLAKGRLDYTKRMLDTLERYTHLSYDHFVIDNGSTDKTVAFLSRLPSKKFKLILNPDNKGISIGWNQALDAMGEDYDYIVKVDNDCEILSDNWLEEILEITKAFDDNIVLSPYVDGLREHKGGVTRYDSKNVNGHKIGLTKHLGGISLVVPVKAYQGFRFNEKLPLKGNQDVTFSAHLNKQGYLMGYVEDIMVSHMDSTEVQHQKYPNYFKLRELENQTVYGEHPLITKIKKPYRRWLNRGQIKFLKKTASSESHDESIKKANHDQSLKTTYNESYDES